MHERRLRAFALRRTHGPGAADDLVGRPPHRGRKRPRPRWSLSAATASCRPSAPAGPWARSSSAIPTPSTNLRQSDVGEREALAQLRAGNVAEAVDWYVANDRIVTKPTIEEAWRPSSPAGPGTSLLRSPPAPGEPGSGRPRYVRLAPASVAELNRLGRAAWAEMGNLSGPELTAPGGAAYAAGDRIVTLAPGAGGRLVTSERGSELAVDSEARTLTARMDDGRTQYFGTEDLARDRLAIATR
jgi:hypothetical protein